MRKYLAIVAITLLLTISMGYAGRAQDDDRVVKMGTPTPGEEYCATPVGQLEGTPPIIIIAPTTAASPGGSAPGTPIGLEPCGTPIPMEGTPAGGQGQQAQGGQAETAPTIELVDIAYKPSEFTIPANTDVTVTLNNTGQLPHTFDIDELNIHSDEIQPGQSGTVTINAAAGTYQFYCREPGHKAAGMVGTLTVK